MTTAREFRERTWTLLKNGDGKGGYGRFLITLLLLGLLMGVAALGLVVLFGGCLAVVFAIAKGSAEELSPSVIACSTAASAVLVFGVLYLVGFAAWANKAMSIAFVRRGLDVRHAISGWGNGWRMVSLILWSQTFIFFWSLLFIVPGIRASFSYAMAPYLLIDHPDWSPRRCIDESKRMMEGERFNYFCLNFSFIGWWLLTLPLMYLIGGFAQTLLTPYTEGACALFYENLLDRADAANAVSAAASDPNERPPAPEDFEKMSEGGTPGTR